MQNAKCKIEMREERGCDPQGLAGRGVTFCPKVILTVFMRLCVWQLVFEPHPHPFLDFAFPSYFRPSSHMISAAATPALRDSVSASMGMYTLRSQAAMTAGDNPCPSLPMTAATG